MTSVTDLPAHDIDLSDPALWAAPDAERDAVFAKLRRELPISFHAELAFDGNPPGPGYWALTRFDDVWKASRNPRSSSRARA
jgi:cytochrome P450